MLLTEVWKHRLSVNHPGSVNQPGSSDIPAQVQVHLPVTDRKPSEIAGSLVMFQNVSRWGYCDVFKSRRACVYEKQNGKPGPLTLPWRCGRGGSSRAPSGTSLRDQPWEPRWRSSTTGTGWGQASLWPRPSSTLCTHFLCFLCKGSKLVMWTGTCAKACSLLTKIQAVPFV